MTRMEAKDGSDGFDLAGTYDKIVPMQTIVYTMDGEDKRKVKIEFEEIGNSTALIVHFDPENINPIEMQKGGWQAILANFKNYIESH